ncbi:MAG: thiol-disulfide oxidoreductase DCC family protein [Pseudoalteromonas sp.]|uniref:thiol-disulfide oxidoreductase DCC family protein n=1 Tax=unclassified Pseudoalteromonas TaxID=194690 RepID=UPI003F9EB82A
MSSFNVQQLIKSKQIILFDGQCKLCNAWCNFIIKHDKKLCFKLCSVQSDKGQAILNYFNYPMDNFKTMIYVQSDVCLTQSDAVLAITNQLGWPWRAANIMRLIPKRLRNWVYDRIAFNRYRLFGKLDYCRLPKSSHEQHYL